MHFKLGAIATAACSTRQQTNVIGTCSDWLRSHFEFLLNICQGQSLRSFEVDVCEWIFSSLFFVFSNTGRSKMDWMILAWHYSNRRWYRKSDRGDLSHCWSSLCRSDVVHWTLSAPCTVMSSSHISAYRFLSFQIFNTFFANVCDFIFFSALCPEDNNSLSGRVTPVCTVYVWFCFLFK